MSICVPGVEWNWKEQIKYDSAGMKVVKTAQVFRHLSFRIWVPETESNPDRHGDTRTTFSRHSLHLKFPPIQMQQVNFRRLHFHFAMSQVQQICRSRMTFVEFWPVQRNSTMYGEYERKGGTEKVFRKYRSLHKCVLRSSSVGGILRGYNRGRRQQQWSLWMHSYCLELVLAALHIQTLALNNWQFAKALPRTAIVQ